MMLTVELCALLEEKERGDCFIAAPPARTARQLPLPAHIQEEKEENFYYLTARLTDRSHTRRCRPITHGTVAITVY